MTSAADAREAGTRDMTPAVLVVDDDRELSGMLAEVLADSGYRVETAADGHTGMHLALTRDYDLLIVDRKMPGIDGIGLVTRLRRAGLRQPVLMLTALGDVADRVDGLDAGADDYLVKPFEFAELLARVRSLRRRHPEDALALPMGAGHLDASTRTAVRASGEQVSLTASQFAVLWQLASRPRRVFTREELRTVLSTVPGGASIIDTYVYYLRRKAGRAAIRTVRGLGYRAGEL